MRREREKHGQERLGGGDAAGGLAAKEEEGARGVVVADGGIPERGRGGALDEAGDVEPLEGGHGHGGGYGLCAGGGEGEEEDEHRSLARSQRAARAKTVDDDLEQFPNMAIHPGGDADADDAGCSESLSLAHKNNIYSFHQSAVG